MDQYVISTGSRPHDLLPVVMAFHELLNRLPVTARSLQYPGVRIENGVVIDEAYSGPALEEAIRKNSLVRATPSAGSYKGIPVVVAPLRNSTGEAIGAIGVVDMTGIFDLATLMEHQSDIIRQVCGTDPCPLPSEAIDAKR
ncbi:MAG: DUF2111 domain-containing protein [Methanomicrobiaceae archaeon]|nr:DUF2111 domain-containing protein [Methanomicrobiaceae archaeon]